MSGPRAAQTLRQRLTSACVILLVTAACLDHRPIPRVLDLIVALVGTGLAAGLAVRAARRTRILYLAGALFGVALALSSLPFDRNVLGLGVGRAFYVPALVLVAVAAVLAWPELRAAFSQDRERMRTAAVENSRAHVSRELHDETLQALVHLRRSLERAAASTDEGLMRKAAEDGAAVAAEQITALRDIIADLHPSVLTELGLSAALETLADRTARRHPEITITYRPPKADEAPVDLATALTAYRITQEALSNAVKHSGATHVAVRLTQHGDQLVLEVSDNGLGLRHSDEQDAPGEAGGLGIPAMRARAALHAGDVTIHSDPAVPATGGLTGTTVTASLRAVLLPTHRGRVNPTDGSAQASVASR
ncbi:sensor histidine kinase [Cryptosporangium phraense]|uniref:Histidine kinase domain-containing protein n=1 Tax=Cryptosporangium phraense TaxID=2593070 RepID=A0A545AZV3_9ACTN|nr:ATP-binding protein [Cryptosporangium phraense]TQS46857.1 hypothetical protein FL583_00840 [Cryptosporangium phraense]